VGLHCLGAFILMLDVGIKGCPYCGHQPIFSSSGFSHALNVTCCGTMSVSKFLILTEEERETYDPDTHLFSDEAEEKVKDVLIDIWNTRVYMSHPECVTKRVKQAKKPLS